MTPLAATLMQRIAALGPISLADYMSQCLLDPSHGYYSTGAPFGAAGDFITAPEISQMFGELLGLALAQSWLDQGAPTRIILAEPGPGRATLMADMLRAMAKVPGLLAAADLHLIEASPRLRAVQKERLAGHRIQWHDSIETLPEGPLYLVANEFFDALPIRAFERRGNGWAERQIGLAEGALAFGLAPAMPLAALAHRLADTREGDLVETCAPAAAIAQEIGARIAQHGGAAILVDYGDWRSLGDTFQALRAHQKESPLAHPGQADLTAHVDFEPLARAARGAGAAVSQLTTQGLLLHRLGIVARTETLAQQLSGAALENHLAAYRRLTDPQEMGNLFKALAIYPIDGLAPPGFAPAQEMTSDAQHT